MLQGTFVVPAVKHLMTVVKSLARLYYSSRNEKQRVSEMNQHHDVVRLEISCLMRCTEQLSELATRAGCESLRVSPALVLDGLYTIEEVLR